MEIKAIEGFIAVSNSHRNGDTLFKVLYGYNLDSYKQHNAIGKTSIRMKSHYNNPIDNNALQFQSNRKSMSLYSIKQKKDHSDFDGMSHHTEKGSTNLHTNNTNFHVNEDNMNYDESQPVDQSSLLEQITTKVAVNDEEKHKELKKKIEKKVDFNIAATTTSTTTASTTNVKNDKSKNPTKVMIGGKPLARRGGQRTTTKPVLTEASILSDDHNHHNVALGYVSTENLHNIEIKYVAECDMPTELGDFRFRAYKCEPAEKFSKMNNKIKEKQTSPNEQKFTSNLERDVNMKTDLEETKGEEEEDSVIIEENQRQEQLLQKLTGLEPVVMMKGKIKKGINDENVLLRVHDQCLTSEVFGSRRCDCKEQLELALTKVNELDEDKFGCVIYLQQEGRGIGLANKVAAYALQDKGADTVDANRQLGFQDDERTYEVIPQIMEDMGIKSIQLMTNNPFKVKVLKSLGVNITKVVPIIVQPNKDNYHYLFSKADRMEHKLDFDLNKGINTKKDNKDDEAA